MPHQELLTEAQRLILQAPAIAPNTTPNDGLPYRTIHNVSVQVEYLLACVWALSVEGGPRTRDKFPCV